VKPRRIIDLGCGTGSTTLMLKQAFPEAEVVGLDLSPYMLVVAGMKAQKAGLNIQWLHSSAESVAFGDASFDLVSASFLFHETPPAVSRAILRESFRLLKVGGQVVILDGSQKTLRQTPWLTDMLEDPYINSYLAGSLDAWAGAAGFAAVQTHEHWWTNQVTQGVKPLPGEDLEQVRVAAGWNPIDRAPDFDGDLPGIPAPA
jgi:ubiquinone/menaquinone biosynthesis C-methylase UbiE